MDQDECLADPLLTLALLKKTLHFFFKINKTPFDKNEQPGSKKQENGEYYDAEYISIDDKDEKK